MGCLETSLECWISYACGWDNMMMSSCMVIWTCQKRGGVETWNELEAQCLPEACSSKRLVKQWVLYILDFSMSPAYLFVVFIVVKSLIIGLRALESKTGNF